MVLSGGPRLIKCTEDEDFMSAFDSMLAETIQQRHQEAAKIPQADIAIPMHLKGQKAAKGKTKSKQTKFVWWDKNLYHYS